MTTAIENKAAFEVAFTTREGDEKKGPLALLWSLIESYEVDIFEVSLKRITDDFILYMQTANLDIETSANFAEMAARLIYYKSKLLLPDPGFEEEYEDDVLPLELVDQLLEYKKFQQAAMVLRQFEEQANLSFSRQQSWNDYVEDTKFVDVDLVRFLKVFQDFLVRAEKAKPIEIEEESFTVEELMQEMLEHLQQTSMFSFFEYIQGKSLLRCIGHFLAILELTKQNFIDIEQSEMFDDVTISLK